eukprot:TRINITY_DN3147_c0_g1_i3.p1 TRINITY_DN3147_c0_g1~~TRINITY_DN3147_c0_g1_i3.p1  ORF type:complete len:522 (-),score=57.00 TRINITY_DN3147_c0_g1_i3:61-1626(-)
MAEPFKDFEPRSKIPESKWKEALSQIEVQCGDSETMARLNDETFRELMALVNPPLPLKSNLQDYRLDFRNKNGWTRDLTRECIESNPGPSLAEILTQLDSKLGDAATDPKYVTDRTAFQQLVKAQAPTLYAWDHSHVDLAMKNKDEMLKIWRDNTGVIVGSLQDILTGIANSDTALIQRVKDLERELRWVKDQSILDPERTADESAEWKNQLIIHYNCAHSDREDLIKCMITNKFHNRHFVRAAHIWMAHTGGKGLEKFGLSTNDLNHVRNGLLLCKPIEKAFDRKNVCFLWDPFKQALFLHVVNEKLLKVVVHDGTTFADINGAQLQLPANVWPFRRILNWHARCTFHAWQLPLDILFDYVDLFEPTPTGGARTEFGELNKDTQHAYLACWERGDDVSVRCFDNQYWPAKVIERVDFETFKVALNGDVHVRVLQVHPSDMKLPGRVAKPKLYAKVWKDYQPDQPDELSLKRGYCILLDPAAYENQAWGAGFLFGGRKGIFPFDCVEFVSNGPLLERQLES